MQPSLLVAFFSLVQSTLAVFLNKSIARLTIDRDAPTFQEYYETHTGRGVWKWNVALDAYQRHFHQFANIDAKMLEIGVQSGGSINMYHSVLPKTYYYGMDINSNCVKFNDARTTIYLGDQANVASWGHFFSAITPSLDICIDDGGHQPHQMLATIQQVLPHMNKGGYFLVEDIHGINDDYLAKFFHSAAHTIANLASSTGAKVHSVHLYPFVLGVQLAPAPAESWKPPASTATVADFPSLMNSLPKSLGGVLKLEKKAWGTLFAEDALKNFFNTFSDLNGGVVREDPPKCHGLQDTHKCVMIATNTDIQNLVKGVHIFETHALIEVHAEPPQIAAYRKGDEWIPYSGPSF